MRDRSLRVAWFSFFPVEWLPGTPAHLQDLPRQHPAPWQRVLLAELRKHPQVKIHVLVLRKQFRADESFEWGPVTFHLLRMAGGLRAPSLFLYDTWRIRRTLRQIQPDVVHAWGTEHGAAMVAARLPYPALATVQGLMSWMIELFGADPYLSATAMLERLSLSRLRFATAESVFSTNYLRARYPRLEVDHIDLVPDGRFHVLHRQPEPGRLLFVGPLGPRKGGDLWLRTLAALPVSVRGVVVGSPLPGFRKSMRGQVDDAVWSRIEFRTGLDTDGMAEEYRKATLMVCPTRADTGPTAVKEAVVAGVPVVGSRVGGLPDYVEPGKNGLLFTSGDPDGCVAAVREALAHPLFGRGTVDEGTLQAKRSSLSVTRMAESFLNAYRRVAGQASGAGRR